MHGPLDSGPDLGSPGRGYQRSYGELAGLGDKLAPSAVWQGAHGWPELAVSRSIAAGKSGTSTLRAPFIPDQLLNLGPVVAPVWVYGLIRLFRDSAVRRWRPVGVAYIFLLVVFIALGGKSYYLAGMYPALAGAGASPPPIGRGGAGTGRARSPSPWSSPSASSSPR